MLWISLHVLLRLGTYVKSSYFLLIQYLCGIILAVCIKPRTVKGNALQAERGLARIFSKFLIGFFSFLITCSRRPKATWKCLYDPTCQHQLANLQAFSTVVCMQLIQRSEHYYFILFSIVNHMIVKQQHWQKIT